jgi:probable HAF family extracellular repeat protein
MATSLLSVRWSFLFGGKDGNNMRTSFIRKILCMSFLIFLLCFLLQPPSHAVTQFILEDLGVGGARGINESGQVVGRSGGQAVLWENGSMAVLGPGNALDINESGQIVGYSEEKGVLWENGSTNDLGTTGVDNSPATAINNETYVVGYQHTSSTDSSSPYHAWLWNSVNGLQDIDTTGYSFAYDINDNEVVVGRFGSPAHYPAIWQNGVMTQIGTAEGQAQGINNLNQVVGAYAGHAFLWEDDSMTDLGTIGTANSDAKAINENGLVVGQLTFPGGIEHAMFWQDGQIYDLNDLINTDSGFVLLNAYDINNKGQIVGLGTINGEGHAFLLTPIPAIDEIIEFFNNGVNERTIYGRGRIPWLANIRLWLFGQMLESVKWHLDHDRAKAACKKLDKIDNRCDGDRRPPDFIDGDADTMGTLTGMLDDLETSLGCE